MYPCPSPEAQSFGPFPPEIRRLLTQITRRKAKVEKASWRRVDVFRDRLLGVQGRGSGVVNSNLDAAP